MPAPATRPSPREIRRSVLKVYTRDVPDGTVIDYTGRPTPIDVNAAFDHAVMSGHLPQYFITPAGRSGFYLYEPDLGEWIAVIEDA